MINIANTQNRIQQLKNTYTATHPPYRYNLFDKSRDIYYLLREMLFKDGDAAFERDFKRDFIPALYDVHASEDTANCAFCRHLSPSDCHLHCRICSKGIQLYCSPVLPGILGYESLHSHSPSRVLPWLYREPCRHFERLEKEKYYKNLGSPLQWVKLYNFEVLEGLSNGIVEGERPCHICAASDYEIYKGCLQSGLTCLDSPCLKIAGAVGASITQQNSPDSVSNLQGACRSRSECSL